MSLFKRSAQNLLLKSALVMACTGSLFAHGSHDDHHGHDHDENGKCLISTKDEACASTREGNSCTTYTGIMIACVLAGAAVVLGYQVLRPKK